MFGIGAFELFAILVIAMIILGPERLPKAMGTVGSWIRELRRLTREFRAEFDEEIKLLQGELNTIREEAELTRKELDEIRSDIETSMSEVQEDIEQAGEDIREELTGAEQDVLGEGSVPTGNVGGTVLGKLENTSGSESRQSLLPETQFLNPADVMHKAIVDTFLPDNGQLRAAAQSPPDPAVHRDETGVLNVGTEWEHVDSEPQSDVSNWERPPANRPLAFSPQNGQFGAMLSAVAEAGEEAIASARSALEYQASLAANDLIHLTGRGPAGLAFAWAAQRQAVMDDGTIEVDADNQDRTRVRLHACPYGLTGPDGLAACDLSNLYDRALARSLGFEAHYESRITEQASFCELVISRSTMPQPDSRMKSAEVDTSQESGLRQEGADVPMDQDVVAVDSAAVEGAKLEAN